jgi:hypothetical protein
LATRLKGLTSQFPLFTYHQSPFTSPPHLPPLSRASAIKEIVLYALGTGDHASFPEAHACNFLRHQPLLMDEELCHQCL